MKPSIENLASYLPRWARTNIPMIVISDNADEDVRARLAEFNPHHLDEMTGEFEVAVGQHKGRYPSMPLVAAYALGWLTSDKVILFVGKKKDSPSQIHIINRCGFINLDAE